MKSLMNLKTIFILLTIVFSQLSLAQHHHNHEHDAPSVHGMLLFGKSKIYLSHLPMFHIPHNYQVLFEVQVPEAAKKKYIQSTKNSNETVYTIVPQSFSLSKMAEKPKPFMAKLFKGHFERGGSPITENIEFKVTKVLYFKKFKANAIKPLQASYILIGNQQEQFLIHSITSKPDFDHISEVKIKDATILKKIMDSDYLNLTVNYSNKKPLPAGEELQAFLNSNEALKIKLMLKNSLYIEFGDLSF